MRILITGASGAGSSTLAAALAERTGLRRLDGDDYFWIKPQPPFADRREPAQRLALLARDLLRSDDCILAGAIDGWGLEVEDAFDLVVFLYLDTPTRIERLRQREMARFGAVDREFLEWAAHYDAGTTEGRCLASQREWLGKRQCKVVELAGDLSVEQRVHGVLAHLKYPHV